MDDPRALCLDNVLFAIVGCLKLTTVLRSNPLSKTQWLTLDADVADLAVVVATVGVDVEAPVVEAARTRRRSGEFPAMTYLSLRANEPSS